MRKVAPLLSVLGLMLMGAAFAAPLQTVTLAVENMTCGTCPVVVSKALKRVPGVTSTVIDMEKRTATVTFDPDKANSAKLTEATTNAGFPSKLFADQ